MKNINYFYWLQKQTWRPIEAASLLLGSAVADMMEEEGDYDLLSDHPISQLERKIQRAIAEDNLEAKETKVGFLIKPIDVITWAKEKEISLPKELDDFLTENFPTKTRGRPSARKEIFAEVERRTRTRELHDDWHEECVYLARFASGIKGTAYAPDSIERFYQLGMHQKNLKIKKQKN